MASSLSIAATSSKGASLWPALRAGAVEGVLNRYLALDPDSPRWLAPLAGKVVALHAEPFGWTWYLCPGAASVQVLEQWLGPVDVSLRATPAAFARLALAADPHGELFSGGVTVEGNMDVARRFQDLFQRLDIDWEEHVSRYTGDLLAHRLGNAWRAGRAWLDESHRTLRLNVAEFLQEESRDLPAAPEVAGFHREVDKLRADCDRLEARLVRLRSTLDGA